MWLEAIVPKDDLIQLAADLLPLTVRLGDDGELQLHDATEVALIPGVGLRIVCGMHLRWPVLRITVPITVRTLAVLLRPEVVPGGEDGEQIAFKLQIDHADVAGLPSAIDQGVVRLVNRELDARHTELAWGYARTLSHYFDLPDSVRPPERFELAVDGARVKATEDALGLAIQFHARVHRREDGAATKAPGRSQDGKKSPEPAGATNAAPAGGDPGTMRARVFRSGRAELAAFAGLGVVALLAGYALGARLAPRWARSTDIRSGWWR